MHEVLVNCLFKLAQEKSVARQSDRPAMTIAVDLGRKATNKQTCFVSDDYDFTCFVSFLGQKSSHLPTKAKKNLKRQ